MMPLSGADKRGVMAPSTLLRYFVVCSLLSLVQSGDTHLQKAPKGDMMPQDRMLKKNRVYTPSGGYYPGGHHAMKYRTHYMAGTQAMNVFYHYTMTYKWGYQKAGMKTSKKMGKSKKRIITHLWMDNMNWAKGAYKGGRSVKAKTGDLAPFSDPLLVLNIGKGKNKKGYQSSKKKGRWSMGVYANMNWWKESGKGKGK